MEKLPVRDSGSWDLPAHTSAPFRSQTIGYLISILPALLAYILNELIFDR